MKNILLNNIRTFAQITREIYIIDDFKTDMFIEADILISKRIIIDFVIQVIKINSCRNITISMNSRARFELIKRTIKLLTRIVLLSRVIV